jgi:hypothetical protein
LSDPTDSDALAYICSHILELRHDAAENNWAETLSRAIRDLHAGAPATKVYQTIEPNFTGAGITRAGSPVSDLDSIVGRRPIAAVGEYMCPKGLCGRTGQRDDLGREPTCMDGRPMRVRAEL